MSDAMEWLADGQIVDDGEAVTIARGATSVEAVGVFGRTNFRTSDANQRSILERSDADLIVKVDAWGALTTPEPDDEVTRGAEVYRVYSPTGEPCFRATDQFGHSWRVHLRRET